MKIAVIGATGLVGERIIDLLSNAQIPVNELIPVASLNSRNKQIFFNNKSQNILTIDEALEKRPHIAIFSAGVDVSLTYAPLFAERGTRVIDNSSAWRMDESKKLIIPEINGDIITAEDMIIANPNCSTIQMLVPLYPLHKRFGIKRIIVSTYQSVSGSGSSAVGQLRGERAKLEVERFYPHSIDMNVIPHCDAFMPNDYTKEEMKLVNETKKIFASDSIRISATAVRVPVIGGHSESVNVEFEQDFQMEEVKQILSDAAGVVLYDEPEENKYPMPSLAHNKDEIFVGRVRRDISHEKAINMWIVADNLRKGAATNAVQIAEIVKNFVN